MPRRASEPAKDPATRWRDRRRRGRRRRGAPCSSWGFPRRDERPPRAPCISVGVSLSVDAWISARPSSAERRLKEGARPESCGQLSIAEHRPRASAGTVARGGLVGGRARGDYCRRLWIPRSPFWVAGTTPFWGARRLGGILRLGESPRGEPLRCHLSLDGRLCLGGRRWLGFIRSRRFVSSQAAPARARLIEAIIAQPT